MKQTFFMLMLLAASTLNAQQHKLTIAVDGIEQIGGTLYVAVYDSENFMKKPLYGTVAKADKEEITIVLDGVAQGEYAVSIFHDENDNGKLDTGAYGIPVEKTGSSNNAKATYGPPKFNDCKFTVEDDTVIYITLTSYELPK
ncbi:MAG: DUF2141 domain-containing protein [Prevotellaceae bacterium]|jgi:uncharacterized protein (DUF2141 family)|nr:DUF2141 domain-containing protein [Prevotellaceae bacterium]